MHGWTLHKFTNNLIEVRICAYIRQNDKICHNDTLYLDLSYRLFYDNFTINSNIPFFYFVENSRGLKSAIIESNVISASCIVLSYFLYILFLYIPPLSQRTSPRAFFFSSIGFFNGAKAEWKSWKSTFVLSDSYLNFCCMCRRVPLLASSRLESLYIYIDIYFRVFTSHFS